MNSKTFLCSKIFWFRPSNIKKDSKISLNCFSSKLGHPWSKIVRPCLNTVTNCILLFASNSRTTFPISGLVICIVCYHYLTHISFDKKKTKSSSLTFLYNFGFFCKCWKVYRNDYNGYGQACNFIWPHLVKSRANLGELSCYGYNPSYIPFLILEKTRSIVFAFIMMIDSSFLDAVYEDRVLLSKLIKVISILNTQ